MLHEEFGLISVIMAAYNAEQTIGLSIGSVLNQTFTNWELIVVDDCSVDKTAEIVARLAVKDKRIKLVTNSCNSGVSITRQKGLAKASGDWIAILDSDDMWANNKLEKQIDLQKKTDGALIYTGSTFVAADGTPIDWYLHAPLTITYHQLLKQNLISNSSALVRKEMYSKNYAAGDSMHEDFATWLSMLKAGVKAYGVDEPLLVYRLTKTSKSGNKLNAARMQWNTYRYIGLNSFAAGYYMCWYAINGLLKYRNLKR